MWEPEFRAHQRGWQMILQTLLALHLFFYLPSRNRLYRNVLSRITRATIFLPPTISYMDTASEQWKSAPHLGLTNLRPMSLPQFATESDTLDPKEAARLRYVILLKVFYRTDFI